MVAAAKGSAGGVGRTETMTSSCRTNTGELSERKGARKLQVSTERNIECRVVRYCRLGGYRVTRSNSGARASLGCNIHRSEKPFTYIPKLQKTTYVASFACGVLNTPCKHSDYIRTYEAQ